MVRGKEGEVEVDGAQIWETRRGHNKRNQKEEYVSGGS